MPNPKPTLVREPVALTISPEYAKTLLDANTLNRPINERLVAELARAMSNERWKLNGETIKIASSGRLLDGQHRLMACVRCDHDFVTYLVDGLDESTFDTIGTGKARSAPDVLNIAGYKNRNVLASSARWVVAIEQNKLVHGHGVDIPMSPQECLAFVESRHPELSADVDHVCAIAKIRVVTTPSLIAPIYYLAKKRHAPKAEVWLTGLATGENLARNNPILMARARLISDRLSQNRQYPPEKVAMLIRSWNAHLHDKPITQLRGSIQQPNKTHLFPVMER